MTSEFSYLEDLTLRVDLSKDCYDHFDAMVVESLIAQGLLVQVVPKQRTWGTLHKWAEWLGKKIGVR